MTDIIIDEIVRLIEQKNVPRLEYMFAFHYPFKAFNKFKYDLNTNPLTSLKKSIEKLKPIHKNIRKILWFIEGRNDYNDWTMIGIFNNIYFLFEAKCCYTGFSVSGSIDLSLFSSLKNLVKYGLSTEIRKQIIDAKGNYIFSQKYVNDYLISSLIIRESKNYCNFVNSVKNNKVLEKISKNKILKFIENIISYSKKSEYECNIYKKFLMSNFDLQLLDFDFINRHIITGIYLDISQCIFVFSYNSKNY